MTTGNVPLGVRVGADLHDNRSGPEPVQPHDPGPNPHHSTQPRSEPAMSMAPDRPQPSPNPDDPRHGTPAGASLHWKASEKPCEPCRQASARARKRNRYLELTGQPATLPATGTVRRIHALMAIGWTQPQIAREAGITIKTLRNPLFRGASVYRGTHEAVAEAYERLCMKLPPESTSEERRGATYARTVARKNGWLPPLAWDDIDTDPEPNLRPLAHTPKTDVDEAVVLRVMAGERLPMTTAERFEVVRRLRVRGFSLSDIEAHTGIGKPERYIGEAAA